MFFNRSNKKIKSNYLFVIGSGRSGTHFIGRAIGKHPQVELFLEETENFRLVKEVAILEKGEKYQSRLVKRYKKLQKISKQPWILEKSHPNIWLTEGLLSNFPDSYFIGMQRDLYQIVSSMLNHDRKKNVRTWFDILPTNKCSRFLGINDYNISYYKDLPIEAKCVIRWLSHTFELERLKKEYPDKVFIFDYSIFCENFESELFKIEQLTALNLKEYAERPKSESLQKFKNLTNEQIKIIDETFQKEKIFFEKIYKEKNN
ncbi:sulfotransferase [Salinimicrobium oceani]|uniref:Sulfotransferase family protein n=1 Tax=Salinimicrobium oceani TaxID=2722702 RepID=A0ABX1D425_9FLAO|nr:sulfotransferase [Salinimicrobium oceani]NJW53453.1 hypothetical protein [Salinimicrobium oceani]